MIGLLWIGLIGAGLAAMLFIPDGIILEQMISAYYTGETVRLPLSVQPYGVTIAIGTACAAAVFLAICLVKGRRGNLPLRRGLAFLAGAVCFGFAFSRLLYCLTSVIFYFRTAGAGAILRWWEGGMSMTGMLLGVLLSAALTIRKEEKACEAAVPALAVAIAAARLAETFGTLGRGKDVEFENLFSIPDEYGFGSVLNVWLIELIAVLLIGAAMLAWRAADRRCPRGFGFLAAFLIVYGIVQILMESLRNDRHMIWGFVKAQQLFSFLLASLLLMSFAWVRNRKAAAGLMSAALAAAVFGLEKALDRLDIPDIWIYLVFAVVITGALWFAVYVMRKEKTR